MAPEAPALMSCFFNDQTVHSPKCKIPGDAGPGDAAADNKDLGFYGLHTNVPVLLFGNVEHSLSHKCGVQRKDLGYDIRSDLKNALLSKSCVELSFQ